MTNRWTRARSKGKRKKVKGKKKSRGRVDSLIRSLSLAVENLLERLADRLKRQPASHDVVGGTFRACPPASEHEVASTEKRLGFSLPATLRTIYLHIANVGFGPGYGVMGVAGGFTDDLGNTVADLYQSYREPYAEDPAWQWPDSLLPICHWGCVVYSAVDCSSRMAPVYMVDVGMKEPGTPMKSIIRLQKPSIDAWLSDWLDGRDLWDEFYVSKGAPENTLEASAEKQ